MGKHAYLIMAHNQWELLSKLINCLDDERNDLFIHIDSKVKEVPYDLIKASAKHAGIIFTDRVSIIWGTHSVVPAELVLLRTAYDQKQNYEYYHFISGVDLPLKNQDEIHRFFDAVGQGRYNFINFHDPDHVPDDWLDRIRKYNFFTRYFRTKKPLVNKLARGASKVLVKLQGLVGVDRLKRYRERGFVFNYGAAWFSITNDFTAYILENTKAIEEIFYKYTFIPDEMFIQTLAFSSRFKETLFRIEETDLSGYNNMRLVDWERGRPYVWRLADKEELDSTDMLFARKFDLNTDRGIIEHIYHRVMAQQAD